MKTIYRVYVKEAGDLISYSGDIFKYKDALISKERLEKLFKEVVIITSEE